nr:hypothetical protein [Ralstonia solanacearum]
MTLPRASNCVGAATVLMGRPRAGELVALLDRLYTGELAALLAALMDRLCTGELAALLAALLDRLRKFENSGLGVRAARPEEPSSTSCVRPRDDPDEREFPLKKLLTCPLNFPILLILISCVSNKR